ncbi:acyl-CoA dehydrogenase [Bordetella ansorpii]|uniref:Acyl-CoA dehydrogenase n=1 Tax=Bordetella ansorpii TaxID=288768 RepID=A0A157Q1P5_9BORD|nr:acyl-CoA dehydrogenase family protein [Bordetella ansorpii]SAI39802.1 acyl-CoA dehydrogenase [Bordetella ansorpii]
MSFEPSIAFAGMLSDSAARVAQDQAGRYPQRPDATLIGDMGWSGVLVPEAQGGVGGGFADLASIVEALARHAVDLPVITRCGIVPTVLSALPGCALASSLSNACAEGEAVIELAGPLSASEPVRPLAARLHGNAWRVSGATAEAALTGDCTHVLLVCEEEGRGPVLAAVPRAALAGQPVTAYRTMEDLPVQSHALDDWPLPPDTVLANGPQAQEALRAGWRVAVAAVAADTVACMGASLSRAIAYLLERKQFGQALAEFQALRHDAARLYIEYEIARNLLQASLRSLEAERPGPATDAALDLLGMHVGQQAVPFAETIIQLHGGMGMTREMPAARLAVRMLANAVRHGDPLAHRQRLHQMRTA